MNPLVEEMLTAKNRQDLEIAMLEDLLLGEAGCQAKQHGEFECSIEVTHRFKCCGYDQTVCDVRTLYLKNYYAFYLRCAHCKNRCWTITPI